VPARPEGRDSAKKERVTDASSSSTVVDVLQRIHDNREKCQKGSVNKWFRSLVGKMRNSAFNGNF
jgi:hypothetical protein